MPPFSLRNLLEEQSRDLFDAQSEYSAFLGELDQEDSDQAMQEQIREISTGTRANIADLEAICALLDVEPSGVKCEAMSGLIREGKEADQEYTTGAVRDAALIAIAQRIAHYEIAGFGTARAFADQLKKSDVKGIFDEMLSRAFNVDKALTKLATGSWLAPGINARAASET